MTTGPIETERLTLVPATAAHFAAELDGAGALEPLLRARVPATWPPDLFDGTAMTHALSMLEADPGAAGWLVWYLLRRLDDGSRVAVGICGFKGPPSADGTIEIGYSVLRPHQRRGYATEAVHGLLRWAFAHPEVNRVAAETYPELVASLRVMEKNNLKLVGPGSEPGVVRYEVLRWEHPPVEPLPAAGGAARQAADASVRLRPARDDDAEGLISLIASCFADYPGCVLDVDGEEPELRRIASAYAERDGRFWVAETDRRVVGCVGASPLGEDGIELRKLYVSRRHRRRGLGARLCGLVESEARERGARHVELWSDTRFTAAHRLYERLGFCRLDDRRELHDRSGSVELHFRKDLDEPDEVPAPEIEPARADDLDELRGLLEACELPSADVEPHLDRFLVVRDEGRIAGAAGLEAHGAAGLLRSVAVLPEWRGRGLAARLTRRLIAGARREGLADLYLLTLDAQGYFERLGFRAIAREAAPEGVRATREYRELCPASAVLMRLRL